MFTKRVACYARVSTMDQSTGLESQVRVLKTYCEQNQIENVEFFTDEGISGTKVFLKKALRIHFKEANC